ncbi:MAG: Na/Pi cotransporter family protein [Eubacterium sp.]|nr:Na/Pi cotransporter family protein [Eubacterium sp.]
MTIYNIFALVGGLAFFLFGMNVMSNYLEKMAGGRLEGILKKLTANPIESLALGAIITIAIQSSSALTVMLVGLVNSGIMEFGSIVNVIMGSDIGTTLTAWILSLNGISSDNIFISMLKPQNFSPVVAIVGVFMIMGCKEQKKKDIGTIFCGFAVLMYGMTLMSESVSPLAEMPQFQNILIAFDNPFLGVLIGTAFTGVIQASAASIGVLQALSLTGKISFGMAIPIVMGANIGTCVTALLSSIGVSRKAKRVPALHILIKVLGTAIWMMLYIVLRYFVRLPLFDKVINSFQIAVFHSIFNIGTIAILLPFSGKLVKLVERMVKVDESDEVDMNKSTLLDERLLLSPGLAVAQCRDKTVSMAKLARKSFSDALKVFDHFDQKEIDNIIHMEQELDYLEDELDTYLVRLSAKDMTESDSDQINEMLHSINDFERIGDHAINMTKLAEQMHAQKLHFSEHARAELAVLSEALNEILDLTLSSFENDDQQQAKLVEPLEEVIDDLTKEIKNRHIDRLRTGECRVELGIILTDYITNCERVSDHCSNVGVCIIQTKNSSFETHGYLNEVKYGGESEFVDEFDGFQDKYKLPAVEPFKKKKAKKGKDKDAREGKGSKEPKTAKPEKDARVKAKDSKIKPQK